MSRRVYVNHLSIYLIGLSSVQLTTDALGTITIVEATASLAATRYQVAAGSDPQIPVNTMDAAWKRNSQYTTAQSLQSAKIVNRDGTTRDFVPAGTSPAHVQLVATSNQSLAQAYDSVSSAPTPPSKPGRSPRRLGSRSRPATSSMALLLRPRRPAGWLASGVDALVQVVKDVANEVWHIVVTIGGAIYHAAPGLCRSRRCRGDLGLQRHQGRGRGRDQVPRVHLRLAGHPGHPSRPQEPFICLGQSTIDGIDAAKAQVTTLSQELQTQIAGWA